jgi:hypothetical protein
MAKNRFKIPIRGHDWEIVLMTQEEFAKKFDDNTAALAAPKELTLYFNTEELDLDTIIHELVHAYYSHSGTNSASLHIDQIEEVFCELFGVYGEEIIRVSRKLRKVLKGLAKDLS